MVKPRLNCYILGHGKFMAIGSWVNNIKLMIAVRRDVTTLVFRRGNWPANEQIAGFKPERLQIRKENVDRWKDMQHFNNNETLCRT